MLFTASGVAGIIGPRIAGVLYDKYKNYQIAFYTAAVLAAVTLLCELAARRPVAPEGWAGRKGGAGGSLASRSRCSEAQDVSSYGA
jgi:predicted MFS family arabinose efflux permease